MAYSVEANRIAGAKWRAKNRDQQRARVHKWYCENKDKITARRRRLYAQNPEEARAKAKESRNRNREAERARNKAYREANKEILAAKRRARWLADPVGQAAIAIRNVQKRMARKAETICRLDNADIQEIMGHDCFFCGSREQLSIAHDIPLSMGGPTTRANIFCLCGSCNSSMGTKTLSQVIEQLPMAEV